ncbi:MAG: type II toxin-antitoxin system VapC family toxin [Thermomicrobiales bacterium]|nr:type II toxin-antitoxin system VapC family toxin [Thermomicrobiales bacterium]
MLFYFDTSALVKLVVDEPKSLGLITWLDENDCDQISSQVATIELFRSVRRVLPSRVDHAQRVIAGIEIIKLDDAVVDLARSVAPDLLRTLDAIHLSTALAVANEIEGFVTYDSRLADAARQHGFRVVAPA